MDAFSQAVDGADAHEYGAWTFVGWLFNRHKIDWHELRESFVASAHSDATPVLTSLLSKSGDKLGDEVATYWADHTNVKPQFGPTAKMTEVKAGEDTSNDEFPLADPLGPDPARETDVQGQPARGQHPQAARRCRRLHPAG